MDETRREFLVNAGACVLGAALLPRAVAAEADAGAVADEAARWALLEAPLGVTAEQIKAIVLPSHFNLDEVKQQVARDPRLVHARLPEFDEAPIEAASHVGNREIAEYLLGRGARYKIQCACMLGQLQAVAAFLDAEPQLVTQPGAHRLPLMYHAAHSGNLAVLELLAARGGGQDYGFALHSAAEFNNTDVAQWLLAQGAELDAPNFKDLTPLDVAREREHSEVAQVLEEAQARRSGGAGQ